MQLPTRRRATHWLHLFVLVGLVTLYAGGTAAGQNEPTAEADRLLVDRDYKGALRRYRALAESNPRSVRAHVGVGRCLLRLGLRHDALDAMERIEAEFPDDDRVLTVLAETYLAEAQYLIDRRGRQLASEIKFRLQDAAERADRAAKINAKNYDAHYIAGLARLLFDPPDATAALAALKRAEAGKARDAEYHYYLGLAHAQNEDYGKSAKAYVAAGARHAKGDRNPPRALAAFLRAAGAFAAAEDDTGAFGTLMRALRVAKAPEPVYAAIWEIYVPEARRERGIAILAKLRKAFPLSGYPTFYAGCLYQFMGRATDAQLAFRRTTKTTEGRRMPEAWARLSQLALALDDDADKAEKLALRALDRQSTNRTAYDTLQRIVSTHVKARRLVEAEKLTRRILTYRRDDGKEWANLGLFLRDQGRFHDAAAAYGRAVKFASDHAQIQNDAGVVLHYHLERRAAGVKLYRRAIELDPNTVDALENLGVAMFETGDLDAARGWFERVLQLQPRRKKTRHYLRLICERSAREPG